MIILIKGSMSHECVRPMSNRSDTLTAVTQVFHAFVQCYYTLK